MNHNEFVQTLKAGKVSGAYLFEGVEENIKSVTLAALRKAVLADGLAELNESVMENPSAGEIIAACETLPFASDKRLVVVRELMARPGGARRKSGSSATSRKCRIRAYWLSMCAARRTGARSSIRR